MAKRSFFQRLFAPDPLIPAPSTLEQRVNDLERTLKLAVREWDTALAQLVSHAGRASKLNGLIHGGSEREMTPEEQINARIRALRSAPFPYSEN